MLSRLLSSSSSALMLGRLEPLGLDALAGSITTIGLLSAYDDCSGTSIRGPSLPVLTSIEGMRWARGPRTEELFEVVSSVLISSFVAAAAFSLALRSPLAAGVFFLTEIRFLPVSTSTLVDSLLVTVGSTGAGLAALGAAA